MRILSTTALLLTLLAIPAGAQDYEDAQGVGVARLSLVNGDVTVQRGDSGELIAGERNAPLVARDHVITGPNSRAEIQFDWANSIRLDSLGEVRIAELEPGDSFIQVVAGTAMFSVLEDSSTLFEVSTPTVSVRPLRRGLYRIEVRQDGSTDVIVRSGEAEIFTANETRRLGSGTALAVLGDPTGPDLVALGNRPFDEWDRWNETRDRDLARNDSYQYVSRDIYGAEDLGRYGRWVYDAPYGWVWAPAVASGWAPYRVGRWAWVDYYGWTWISSDPWGWAPYHYGRWYHAPRYGWVWYPGGGRERHYWRPALVAFFGWSSGRFSVGVSVGFGNVGWVPLAPREIYRPWYGRSGPRNVTVNNVTVVNNVNIVETYRNARFIDGRTAVTSVSSRTFGRGRVTTENIVQVTDRDLTRVAQPRGRLPVEPTSESRRYSDRAARARNVPQAETAVAMSARRGGGGETSGADVRTRTSANAAVPIRPTARVSASNAEVSREPAPNTAASRRRGVTAGAEGTPANTRPGNASRIGASGPAAVGADPGVTPRRSTGTPPAARAGFEGAGSATTPSAQSLPRRTESRATSAPASTPRRSQSAAGREGASPSTEAQRAPARRIAPSADAAGGGRTATPSAGRTSPSVESAPRRTESRATSAPATTPRRSQSAAGREGASPSTQAQRAPARRIAPAADAGAPGGSGAAKGRTTVPTGGAASRTGGRTVAPAVRNAPAPGDSQIRSNARVTSRAPAPVERPQNPAPSAVRKRAPAGGNTPAPETRPSGQSRGAVSRDGGAAGNAGNNGNRGNARPRR